MTAQEIRDTLTGIGLDREEAETETRLILWELFSVSAAAQKCDKDRDYPSARLDDLLARRAKREPLAYILGHCAFYHGDFDLSPDTLIPRKETELLVEEAIRILPVGGRFVDLCTGSGCIAVTIAAERRDAGGIGIDISEGALRMAAHNAQKAGVSDRVTFCRGDVLRDDPTTLLGGKYPLILSNPPYIPHRVLETLPPEVRHEPPSALDGGEDGMNFYRRILDAYRGCLCDGGCFLFEIGYDEGDAILRTAHEYGYACTVGRDLGGLPRIATVRPE